MSKSILVIDTPEACYQCRFLSADEDYCCIKDKLISEAEYLHKKPEWCPLRKMPDKKRYENVSDTSPLKTWGNGWNECIDKILKGEKI